MSKIEKSVEVAVPVRAAYDQWTQFEQFPQFMSGVEHVTQLDDATVDWTARVGGERVRWIAQILDQEPDDHITWRATGGVHNAGTVRFRPLGEGKTRVEVSLDYEPTGFKASVGDAFGVVSRKVEHDLEHFRDYIESRQRPTGGWRGRIRQGQVIPDSAVPLL